VKIRDRAGAFPAFILPFVMVGAAVVGGATLVAQAKRDVAVTAQKYSYTVSDTGTPEIRVRVDDLVTVTFTATDIPHSFTVSDHYRIDRRAEPGRPATFRFRADKAGEFEIRCTLTIDDRCLREMRGKIVVTAK
jgi:heme/copper-type cytochrome/quinol oxidase subunit 2